jgi:CRP-like cAMP-binding protein
MDYALPDLPYDSLQIPVSGGAIDCHRIGTRPRLAFAHSKVLHSPRQNQLLAALPDTDYERVLPHLEFMQLASGSTLHEAGGQLSFAYFPTAGIVSPLCVMENGSAAAVAITGNEGMIGTSLFMGGGVTPDQALVQSAGHAYRLGANRLRQEFERGSYLCRVLLRYTQSLIVQMAQTAVCNRYHSIEQQLCRWLLLSLDRIPANELRLTHELLSNILGVRREGVTEAAGKLQKAGVIRYGRGHITVLSHLELENRVCECYAAVKGESAGAARRHSRTRACRAIATSC